MTTDELFWLAVYWDDFLSRFGLDAYLEVRYGLGEHEGDASVRVLEQPTMA